MIVRDNTARRDIFGKRPAYRMLSPDGRETTDIFAIRETSWLDDSGQVIGVHWDNNSGRTAPAEAVLGTSRVEASAMWGTDDFVPSSLNRLYKGATVTLLDRGSLALWNFAGVINRDENPVARVSDSLPSPEGLAVIWDGRYLSISNELSQARRVTVELSGVPDRLVPMPPYIPRLPDGTARADQAQLIYAQASPSRLEVIDGRAVVEVTMPPARPHPHDRPLAVATSLVVFEVAAEEERPPATSKSPAFRGRSCDGLQDPGQEEEHHEARQRLVSDSTVGFRFPSHDRLGRTGIARR